MRFRPLYINFFIILGIDIALIAASIYGAYLVRFEFSIPPEFAVLFY